ncbi:hypothetical protein RKD37_007932 [Streptomyces ambofaciens]
MNTAVHKTLVVQLQAGDTADRFPVLAHLGYESADPFALTVVFSHDGRVLARWALDREMVAEGLTRPVGVGDVRLRPESRGMWDELRIELLGDDRGDGGPPPRRGVRVGRGRRGLPARDAHGGPAGPGTRVRRRLPRRPDGGGMTEEGGRRPAEHPRDAGPRTLSGPCGGTGSTAGSRTSTAGTRAPRR